MTLDLTTSSNNIQLSHLDAAEEAIRRAGKPLNSHELALLIQQFGLGKFEGSTPHKTINARVSVDIARNGQKSRFVRTAHGRFSLRECGWEAEVHTKPRTIAPLEEDIKILPALQVPTLLTPQLSSRLFSVNRKHVVEIATSVQRAEAEERYDIVQLIPTFVICQGSSILKYQRTKRLPEARLHNSWSINFGGHLQADDFPTLFSHSDELVDLFLMRELYEELEFSETPTINFLGALYLQDTPFERQHLGLVFQVILPETAKVQSMEPGFHINLTKAPASDLAENITALDSWSQLVLAEVYPT